MCSFLSTSCAVIIFIFQTAFSFFQSCFCCTCWLLIPEISGCASKVVKVHLVMSSYLRELSFLILGTGVEECSRQMEKFSYPIDFIQYYLKPHFEMLEIFDTQIILSCLSFNFVKQLRVLKAQSGYEGKESRRENRNQ